MLLHTKRWEALRDDTKNGCVADYWSRTVSHLPTYLLYCLFRIRNSSWINCTSKHLVVNSTEAERKQLYDFLLQANTCLNFMVNRLSAGPYDNVVLFNSFVFEF